MSERERPAERRRRLAESVVGEQDDLRAVLARIEAGGGQLALVVDPEGRLVGTASDGDIRRALLSGHELSSPISAVCNRRFRSVSERVADSAIFQELKRNLVHQMPVLDSMGRPVDLLTIDDLLEPAPMPNPVVIMAGGLGTRLGELTKTMPKPMLPIEGVPLLEHLIRDFRDQGFRHFRLAVNHRAEIIEDHFGNGSALSCEIDYLREDQRLGTAGALSLLDNPSGLPIIVANGDLMVQVRLADMVRHHESSGALATMAVRRYEYQVPYGVIEHEDGRILGLVEKPRATHTISAGVYVLSESARALVPSGRIFDMPDLFARIISEGGRAEAFAIDGYWADVGTPNDYRQVNAEFGEWSAC